MVVEHVLPQEWQGMVSAQQANETNLLSRENVVGVGLGKKIKGGQETGQSALMVLVNQKVAPNLLADQDKVPPAINEVPTDVIEVGVLFAGQPSTRPLPSAGQDGEQPPIAPQTLRGRRRPAMGGDSVGHFRITAGTIATCCYDATAFPGIPPRYYILSNNHVLANSNDARVGDPILQPGPFDGGTAPGDVIARLSRFVPIQFISGGQTPCNFVDAAIAEGEFSDLNRQIYWIGYVRGINASPNVGDIVQKTGRTTNFTTGRIRAINATVDVNYGGGRVARFCRQILTDNISAGGDSGSLVTDLNENAVGLLFAGSSVITVVNPISPVLALLGIRITE